MNYKGFMLDPISQDIIKLALYLDSQKPGLVSEIWIEPNTLSSIKKNLPNQDTVGTLISKIEKNLELIEGRRHAYLVAVFKSLVYQLCHLNKQANYSDFSEAVFGFRINRVTPTELNDLETQIQSYEKQLGQSRFAIFKKHSLPSSSYLSIFTKYINQVKNSLPPLLSDFPDQGFELEIVRNKAWSAFNSHLAPYHSLLNLNADVAFGKFDLLHLAYHEAYGGHHSELSHKDNLLLNENRGEHGLVITFSPQTFISEAIAESVFVFLGGLDQNNDEQMMAWYYDRLLFALQNLATFMHFDDKLNRSVIEDKFKSYNISTKSRENLLNFSLDPLFGKYAPIYHSASNFLEKIYSKTKLKTELIKTLFTQPCTPTMISTQFKID